MGIRIKDVKKGQILKMPFDKHGGGTEIRKCMVTEVYPKFIKARYITDFNNIEEVTFNLGDLVVAGYERRTYEI